MTGGCDDFIKDQNISVNRTHDYEGCWSGYKTALKQIHLDVDANIRGSGVNQPSIQMMINSGVRGTLSQVQQLIGSRGYIVRFERKPW